MSDSKQHVSSFSPLNFLAALSKLHLGVQRNFSWRKPIWNNLFSKTIFFRIFNKKYSDFSRKFLSRIPKKHSMCPEEQSMKKYETKKELINKTFSRNLFWQLSVFWWTFSRRFLKTAFYLRVTFWWKAAIASEILIGNFFLTLGANFFKALANLLPHSCSNCLLRVWRKINCEFQLWAENFDFENFCNFSSINGFRVKIFLFFFQRIFVRAVKAAFYVSRGTVY